VFIEAECHNPWRRPDEMVEDPTPRDDQRDTIFFLPDPGLTVFDFPDNIIFVLADDSNILTHLGFIDRLQRGDILSKSDMLELIGLKGALEQEYGEEPT
jgi:hypothetical protein